MNFDFSDEQKQMRDEARKFLAEKCPPKAVREVLDGKAPYDKALWQGLAEMGFLGVAIPEEFGGAGAGHLELCVIADEMGRANAPVPFSSTVYLAAEALLLAGSDAQKQKWLPKIASGEAIGTLALFEGKGNPSPKAIKLQASGGTLTGVKKPVPDGAIADFAVVAARTGSTGRGFGDLSENFEYHAAKNEQGLLESRIRRLRSRLGSAVVVDEPEAGAGGVVRIGSKVVLEDENGEKMEIEISSVGGVSPDSPLGRALFGRASGDEVDVEAPRGAWRARILSIS